MMSTNGKLYPICPVCSYSFSNPSELWFDNDDVSVDCPRCFSGLVVSRNVMVTYDVTLCDDEEDGE